MILYDETISFFANNHEWLFSGIGVLGISSCYWLFKSDFATKSNSLSIQLKLALLAALILPIIIFIIQYDKPSNHTIKITKAFKTLFENQWSLQPYSDIDNYPCFYYQGRWELDNKHYYMRINNVNGYIYYVAKSVNLYTWCQLGNKEGKILEGLELLTNEVYFSERKIDPLTSPDKKLIGEISALFLDEVHFDNPPNEFKPITRFGRRIGRYNYIVFEENSFNRDIMSRVTKFLGNLTKPECDVNIDPINHAHGENLKKDETVMEFDCKHTPNNDELHNYKKRLIYKGKETDL